VIVGGITCDVCEGVGMVVETLEPDGLRRRLPCCEARFKAVLDDPMTIMEECRLVGRNGARSRSLRILLEEYIRHATYTEVQCPTCAGTGFALRLVTNGEPRRHA